MYGLYVTIQKQTQNKARILVGPLSGKSALIHLSRLVVEPFSESPSVPDLLAYRRNPIQFRLTDFDSLSGFFKTRHVPSIAPIFAEEMPTSPGCGDLGRNKVGKQCGKKVGQDLV